MQSAARIDSIIASGTCRRPILRLPLDVDRPPDRARGRSSTRVSNSFWFGCASSGESTAEHRACGGASASDRRPARRARRSPAGCGSSHCRWRRTARGSRTGADSVSSVGDGFAPPGLPAAFELVRIPADRAEDGDHRAAALPAAPAVDDRPPVPAGGRNCAFEVAGDVFATSAAPASWLRTATPACKGADRRARSSSSSTGRLMAPGRWSSANSAGERTIDDGVGVGAMSPTPAGCSVSSRYFNSGASRRHTLSSSCGCASAVGWMVSDWNSSGG